MSAGLWSSRTVAVLHVELVDDRGGGGDEVEVVFAFKPVADDFEVEKAEEAAAEAEAEGGGGFHFGGEGGVVQREFLDGVAEGVEVVGVDGEEAAEDNGDGGFEAGQGLFAAVAFGGDGVADAGVADLLDRGGEDADFAGAELLDGDHLGFQDGERVDAVDGVGLHHADAVALAGRAPSMTRIMTTTPR